MIGALGQPVNHPSRLLSTKIRIALRRTRVIKLIAAGYSLRQIAALVGVSHETVRTDLAALLRELNERYPPTL